MNGSSLVWGCPTTVPHDKYLREQVCPVNAFTAAFPYDDPGCERLGQLLSRRGTVSEFQSLFCPQSYFVGYVLS